MENLSLSTKFEIHGADAKQNIVQGVASVWTSLVDTMPPTIIQRGAFARTLKDPKITPKFLWQHDTTKPIGRFTDLHESDRGLEMVAKVSETKLGQDALILFCDSVVDQLSIGFTAKAWTHETHDEIGPIRIVTDLDLYEISAVTFAADRAAKIESVHMKLFGRSVADSLRELEKLRRWLDGRQKNNVPEFSEIFGPGWIS